MPRDKKKKSFTVKTKYKRNKTVTKTVAINSAGRKTKSKTVRKYDGTIKSKVKRSRGKRK